MKSAILFVNILVTKRKYYQSQHGTNVFEYRNYCVNTFKICFVYISFRISACIVIFLKEIKIGFDFFMNYLLVPKSI